VSDERIDPEGGNGHGVVGTLTKKDFTSENEVRWCPGCGDYAILRPSSRSCRARHRGGRHGLRVGHRVLGRFTYYMDTYGMHGIHGVPRDRDGDRDGRPDLNVWVVTGDGDALSIGGNHLIHALRRNVNLRILMFNNQIYGLTKGQYSRRARRARSRSRPRSVRWTTRSTPSRSRSGRRDLRGQDDRQRPAAHDPGAPRGRRASRHGVREIYQNCNVFNDGAFDALREKPQGVHNQIRLEQGQPIVFDEGGAACPSVRTGGS